MRVALEPRTPFILAFSSLHSLGTCLRFDLCTKGVVVCREVVVSNPVWILILTFRLWFPRSCSLQTQTSCSMTNLQHLALLGNVFFLLSGFFNDFFSLLLESVFLDFVRENKCIHVNVCGLLQKSFAEAQAFFGTSGSSPLFRVYTGYFS